MRGVLGNYKAKERRRVLSPINRSPAAGSLHWAGCEDERLIGATRQGNSRQMPQRRRRISKRGGSIFATDPPIEIPTCEPLRPDKRCQKPFRDTRRPTSRNYVHFQPHLVDRIPTEKWPAPIFLCNKFSFNKPANDGSGYAMISQCQGETVYGVLYALHEAELKRLDGSDGAPRARRNGNRLLFDTARGSNHMCS